MEVQQTEIISQSQELSVERTLSHYGILTEFVRRVLKQGIDYGTIPGTRKPTLYKSGAEKVCQLFNLRAEFACIEAIQDWTGKEHGLEEPLFFYRYRCTLWYPKFGGQPVGEGTGSANSLENKYRGQHWRFELVNTLDKMAAKRAMVAAVLITCGASQFFSQDLEDWQQTINGTVDDLNEKQSLIDAVGELVSQLGWTPERAQGYLKQNYGVTGRKQLSQRQLGQVVEALTQIKNNLPTTEESGN
jgi:hypothetical protein